MNAQIRGRAVGFFSVIREFIRSIRPVQWVKNVFVFAPLVFGMKLMDANALALSFLTFVLFCAVSGAVYLLNDLSDRERDARHPIKQHRPIASGALPIEVARLGVGLLFGLGCGLAFLVNTGLAVVLTAYFVLNVAYSMQLKHFAYLDITCIAAGFLLRVLAGGLAIDVPVSRWLLACTFLLASLLALGKRAHELLAVAKNGNDASTRDVLSRYRVQHVDRVLKILAFITLASYVSYTVSHATVSHFGSHALVYTTPFVAFGLWRFFTLVSVHAEAQSPTDTMIRDLPFVLNVTLWSILVTAIIYFKF
jgi:4-hydroxybenzoate polyprenyltransferase